MTPLRWLAPCVVLFLLACSAGAQGGYRTKKFPRLGLELPIPNDYDAVPIQPLEKWIVLRYLEDDDKAKGKRTPPEFKLIALDRKEPEEGTTLEVPINSLDRYLREEHPSWVRSSPVVRGDERGGFDSLQYEIRRKDVEERKGRPKPGGWVYSWQSSDRVIVLLGFADTNDEKDWKKQTKIWRHIAERIEITASGGDDKEVEKLRRYYERRDYVQPEYRIEVRRGLSPGWKAEDTENYLIVYSTKDQPLLRAIKSELEAMRSKYEELFPPSKEIDAVSTVRVCKDRDEYVQYGGSPSSAGYWYSKAKELVFYDKENIDRKAGSGRAYTRIVLYHEAFHQYIYYSSGQLAPHSWFNEGYGDYFSGAKISGGKVKTIGVNPWRVERIQWAIESERHVPWEKIVRFSKGAYYANASICYAQGWSMVYFLRESKAVQKNPLWARILPTYFETLKEEWRRQLEKLVEEPGRPEDLEAAAERARELAVDEAFRDVDYREIEAAWRTFTLSLKAPR